MPASGDPMMIPLLDGPKHEVVMAAMHRILRPETYLEIGIEKGETLRAARCPTIGIDPGYVIEQEVIANKPECLLYRMTSDAFFERHDPAVLLGRDIDFAFLDGMHEFEFLLRDFINVERSCHRRSVVALHDCIPADLYLARRDRSDESLRATSQLQGGWCGDVWKVVHILRQYRPDLRVEAFDAAWTGLVTVTNLDPSSEVLAAAYDEAVEAFGPMDLRDYGVRRHAEELRIQDSRILLDPVLMPRHFAF
jgi:hypothetical protein